MAYYNPYYQNPNYSQNFTPNYQQNTQTIQNGGFVAVQSEDEARAYPVAHGMSVTFRDENAPFIYTKTLGFGQLDSPTFEKYRLIKEQNAPNEVKKEKVDNLSDYVTKTEFDALRDELDGLKNTVAELRKGLGDE